MDHQRQQFEDAYTAYADAIFRYMVVRLQNRERALELTQEAFMNTWRSMSRGTHIENMRAFLYKTAHNLFVNEIRTPHRTESLETLKEEKGFEPAYDESAKEEEDLQREAIERIHRAGGPYTDVLLLRFVDGLPVKEIAHMMGEKENTISVQIHRGLEKVKKTYDTT